MMLVDVIREMYINDAGRQIKLLGRSLWIRYNQQLGVEELQIPQDGYHGEYLVEIAGRLIDTNGMMKSSVYSAISLLKT